MLQTPVDAESLAVLGDTVAVFAHPDDETYLCGATMAALRDAGHRVVCVTATRGEQGGQRPPRELAALRTEELAGALAVLGVEEHHWLDLPDGGLADVPSDRPVACLARLVAEVQPRTLLTFGPDGITGHADHVTVGRWARSAVAAAGTDTVVLEAAVTVDQRARFGAVEERLGVHLDAPAAPTPTHALAVDAVLTGSALDRKVAALRCQASQTEPLRAALGDDGFRAWVAREAFR